jgi:hypothetical protein
MKKLWSLRLNPIETRRLNKEDNASKFVRRCIRDYDKHVETIMRMARTIHELEARHEKLLHEWEGMP